MTASSISLATPAVGEARKLRPSSDETQKKRSLPPLQFGVVPPQGTLVELKPRLIPLNKLKKVLVDKQEKVSVLLKIHPSAGCLRPVEHFAVTTMTQEIEALRPIMEKMAQGQETVSLQTIVHMLNKCWKSWTLIEKQLPPKQRDQASGLIELWRGRLQWNAERSGKPEDLEALEKAYRESESQCKIEQEKEDNIRRQAEWAVQSAQDKLSVQEVGELERLVEKFEDLSTSIPLKIDGHAVDPKDFGKKYNGLSQQYLALAKKNPHPKDNVKAAMIQCLNAGKQVSKSIVEYNAMYLVWKKTQGQKPGETGVAERKGV